MLKYDHVMGFPRLLHTYTQTLKEIRVACNDNMELQELLQDKIGAPGKLVSVKGSVLMGEGSHLVHFVLLCST